MYNIIKRMGTVWNGHWVYKVFCGHVKDNVSQKLNSIQQRIAAMCIDRQSKKIKKTLFLGL